MLTSLSSSLSLHHRLSRQILDVVAIHCLNPKSKPSRLDNSIFFSNFCWVRDLKKGHKSQSRGVFTENNVCVVVVLYVSQVVMHYTRMKMTD